MKSSSERIWTKRESTTMTLPRGRQSASSSPGAPGMFSVMRNRLRTPSKKMAAFPGSRLYSWPSPGIADSQVASRTLARRARDFSFPFEGTLGGGGVRMGVGCSSTTAGWGLPLEHPVAVVGHQQQAADRPDQYEKEVTGAWVPAEIEQVDNQGMHQPPAL